LAVEQFPLLSGPNAVGDVVDGFARATRQSLLRDGTAMSSQIDGRVPDDPVSGVVDGSGLRPMVAELGQIQIDRELGDDFPLVIKQPGAFTAALPELVARFACYAVVRNPLAVLGSWNSTQLHVRSGHAPVPELLDPGLAEAVGTPGDRWDRQLTLLEWFYDRYLALLPDDRVIRYEDVVASGGRALAVIAEDAAGLREPLQSRNLNSLYDRDLMLKLGERLLERDGAVWHYYPRSSVESLMDQLSGAISPADMGSPSRRPGSGSPAAPVGGTMP
jgi:hypothetical protein